MHICGRMLRGQTSGTSKATRQKDPVPGCPLALSGRSWRACGSSGNRGTCRRCNTLHAARTQHAMSGCQWGQHARTTTHTHLTAMAKVNDTNARVAVGVAHARLARAPIGAQRNGDETHQQGSLRRCWFLGCTPRCLGRHPSSCQLRHRGRNMRRDSR